MPSLSYGGVEFRSGDRVSCTILEKPINDARIFVSDSSTAYICQNELQGNRPRETFGYQFGWEFGISESGVLSDLVRNLQLVEEFEPCTKPRD